VLLRGVCHRCPGRTAPCYSPSPFAFPCSTSVEHKFHQNITSYITCIALITQINNAKKKKNTVREDDEIKVTALTQEYQMGQTTTILRKNETLTRNEPSSSACHRQIWRAWRKVEEPYPSLVPARNNPQSQSQFT